MWKRDLEERILFLKQNYIEQKIKYEILEILHSYFPYNNIKVKSRIKEFNSAFYKFEHKNYKTIDEIKDLIGIMIICENKKEIYKVKKCIEENKKIIKVKDYIKRPKMGYQSIHIYVEETENIIYEIQIKTKGMQIAQKVVHDYVYKNANSPQKIREVISPLIFNVILMYEDLKDYKNRKSKKGKQVGGFFY